MYWTKTALYTECTHHSAIINKSATKYGEGIIHQKGAKEGAKCGF